MLRRYMLMTNLAALRVLDYFELIDSVVIVRVAGKTIILKLWSK